MRHVVAARNDYLHKLFYTPLKFLFFRHMNVDFDGDESVCDQIFPRRGIQAIWILQVGCVPQAGMIPLVLKMEFIASMEALRARIEKAKLTAVIYPSCLQLMQDAFFDDW